MKIYELYFTSMYFTVTTIVTVGYGDISANNTGERLFCILLMLVGVVAFSFVTGAITSIISDYDSNEANNKAKISILNDIHNDYTLDSDLFNKLTKTIKYDHSKKQKAVSQFVSELPHKLRLELAMVIHERMYDTVNFFKGKDRPFIAWVATLIKPLNIEDPDYIYKEGDEIVESKYFLL